MRDRRHRRARRLTTRNRRMAIGAVVLVAVGGLNGPAFYRFSAEKYHAYKISRPDYLAENGSWETIGFPEKFRLNTVHASLLHTGKVLLVAGSGNNQRNFDAKKFDTTLWDPAANTFKDIDTPKDLFCTGHTQLPDGNLLIAGGTKRYEKLEGDVTKAGGLMIVRNEDPGAPVTLPAGTVFTGKENGKTFVSQDPVNIERAAKVYDKKTGAFLRTEAGTARVYVEAERKGRRFETGAKDHYLIPSLKGAASRNVYGSAEKLALDKKDFQGIKDAFEFDPVAERFVPVDPMQQARWYPTLTTLEDGKVLALSGLNDIGELVPGDKHEVYDPKTRKWSPARQKRDLPTYPAVFLLESGKLFYSGSSSGYGPAETGRVPGVWDLETDRFSPVPGLADADQMETSATVLLPPAQDQRFMVVGGGGIGESAKSTARTRLIDLTEEKPAYTEGPSLERGTRYPQVSILPDDGVLISGGAEDYRGRGASDILQARLYDPKTDSLRRVADPRVGRNYHSGSLLLPDGRVLVFGSDPLYSDAANTKPGTFEQRVEMYTPPYLHDEGDAPELTAGPTTIAHGDSATLATPDAGAVKSARLMRPGVSTHVTDVDQRSVAVDFEKREDGLAITLPSSRTLLPSGWYMLFVTDEDGTPSRAHWVEVP